MFQSRISLYSVFSSKPIPEFKEQDQNKILFPNINVLEDVVLKKIKNDDEYKYQTFFSDKVLEQVSPHFPLVYNNTDDLMMMEKFDGDFCDIETKFESIDEYMSFFLQIIMALHVIDSYGKFHGDLNPGNTLFKMIDDEDDHNNHNDHKGYLKYLIDGETYYIKHYNRLWVVSDFEYAGEKGEVLETSGKGFDEEFFKKLFRDEYTKNIKGSWLYDMYTITHFAQFHKITDRVFQLMKEGKEYSLNPIEAIPLLIKNDIRHIFIKGDKGKEA